MKHIILKAILPLCICISSHAQIISTFDNQETTLGWTTSYFPYVGPFTAPTTTDGAALSHGINGNNKLDIYYSGNSLLYFEAPSDFLGNKSFTYNTSLGFNVGDSGGGAYVNGPDVILVGNGLTLVLDIPTNPPLNSASAPTHFDVALSPSSSWHISSLTGTTPTALQFRSVLSDLTALRIRGLFHQSGVASIDNISMVPEPSVITLLLLTVLIVVAYYLGRTRRCS